MRTPPPPPPLGVQVIKLDSNQGALGGVGVARVGNKRRPMVATQSLFSQLVPLVWVATLRIPLSRLEKSDQYWKTSPLL